MEISEELLTPEFIERVKRQDKRFFDVDLRLKVEQELRDSTCLRLVLDAVAEQAAEALEKLAEVPPDDTKMVVRLQACVMRARFIAKTLNAVIRRGEAAEKSINEEQNTINPEEINNGDRTNN